MRKISLFLIVTALSVRAPAAAQTDSAPVVRHVLAAQRSDPCGIVDIYYSLIDPNCTVSIDISDDGGIGWEVPFYSVSGDIGAGLSTGVHYIVWDGKSDRPGCYGINYLVRVTADDGVAQGSGDSNIFTINNMGIVCPKADLNGDCFVDLADFALMASLWLTGQKYLPVPEDMVLIPAGTFQMGGEFFGEYPVHTVTLDSFYMGQYEITNQQYCDFLNDAYPGQIKVEDNGLVYASADSGNSYPYCDTSISSDSSIAYSGGLFSVRTKSDRSMINDPMINVSWYGAVAYCNWRSGKEGKEPCYNLTTWNCDFGRKGYRLATEAEWEYAARGGLSGKRFPWGDTITHRQANYHSSSYWIYDISSTRGYHPLWDDGVFNYTSPAGFFDGGLKYKVDYNWPGDDDSYQTTDGGNPYGLYDMAGNVLEWCNDWYSSSYYSVSSPNNPTGPATGTARVVRGGDWYNDAPICRVAHRDHYPLTGHIGNVGFRVVLDLY